jgi:quercetin dioxygenase-like cupin family protein
MTSVRKAFIALIPFVVLTVLSHPAAFCGDYEGVKVTQIKKATTTTNGEKISYPKADSPEVTIVTVEIPPRGETGWHAHPVPVLGYVLSGELVVEFEDGKQNRFKDGDAIIEVVNALHNGKNPGNAPVKLVVFYLGAEGQPVTTKTHHK